MGVFKDIWLLKNVVHENWDWQDVDPNQGPLVWVDPLRWRASMVRDFVRNCSLSPWCFLPPQVWRGSDVRRGSEDSENELWQKIFQKRCLHVDPLFMTSALRGAIFSKWRWSYYCFQCCFLWSLNASITPWWWAAVHLINPSSVISGWTSTN